MASKIKLRPGQDQNVLIIYMQPFIYFFKLFIAGLSFTKINEKEIPNTKQNKTKLQKTVQCHLLHSTDCELSPSWVKLKVECRCLR